MSIPSRSAESAVRDSDSDFCPGARGEANRPCSRRLAQMKNPPCSKPGTFTIVRRRLRKTYRRPRAGFAPRGATTSALSPTPPQSRQGRPASQRARQDRASSTNPSRFRDALPWLHRSRSACRPSAHTPPSVPDALPRCEIQDAPTAPDDRRWCILSHEENAGPGERSEKPRAQNPNRSRQIQNNTL